MSSIPKLKRKTAEDNADTTQPRDHLEVMGGKVASKFADPCAHAAKASMACLEKNSYDRSKCADAFQNYRDCKKAWVLQRRKDRAEGREGAFD
ncbi:Mitochondrial copper homeostasis protein [Tilletia horrida]|uniref:Cytochrome c oxidase-assembly factor COX23, mitochondrial n=1 Tax=Tilletia horrida TaxID=155126 RepID=A0AAN6GHI7_9BASI|nr:Mitochondrial copper homeostasis protein [Tilletia horrida]KAK0538229.1 Mitochondrial copper homeostasis protein [Tilletia horrida]KAK0541145.1 Mitochondrial copper homeostasis protein [Tilletia horrida]KAK0565798.1 Mitochondrial copper homeostasis protein [Tilletia horrida]